MNAISPLKSDPPPPDVATAEPHGAELHASDLHAQRRKRLSRIGALISVLIFGASLAVLWHIASNMKAEDVEAAFSGASARQIAMAVLLTVTSYVLLTGYDFLALRQMKLKVPYRTTALASFTSYAVSFTLGFPVVTAGTVRYWIYAPRGLRASQVASLTVIAGITFWLGMGAVLGWSLVREANAVAGLANLKLALAQGLGLAAGLAVLAYLVWVALKPRAAIIQGWRLELPGLKLSLGQMLLGAGDVCAGAGVLFVLLPGGHNISYETFLAIYVTACMLGIASHAPGGLGVFEATMLVALSSLPTGGVLGALLLFRLCYYIGPFLIALAMLGAYEVMKRLRASGPDMRGHDDEDGPPHPAA